MLEETSGRRYDGARAHKFSARGLRGLERRMEFLVAPGRALSVRIPGTAKPWRGLKEPGSPDKTDTESV